MSTMKSTAAKMIRTVYVWEEGREGGTGERGARSRRNPLRHRLFTTTGGHKGASTRRGQGWIQATQREARRGGGREGGRAAAPRT
jgi:hypothetical protein